VCTELDIYGFTQKNSKLQSESKQINSQLQSDNKQLNSQLQSESKQTEENEREKEELDCISKKINNTVTRINK
jgi:uncharacterized FlaG/YvyC family protein